MKRLSASLFALGLVLSLGSTAWAGPVTFTYDFTPSDTKIMGDSGTNWIDMSNQAPNTVTLSSSDVVAANLSVHNNLSDTFNGTGLNAGKGVPYTIKLTLTDGSATTTLAFAGHLAPGSSITNGNPNLTNIIDTAAVVPLVLNGHNYTIQMTSFVSPSPFNSNPDLITKGAIGFHITADTGSGTGPNDTPEPSTMLLSCFGLAGLGFRTWRKRRQLA